MAKTPIYFFPLGSVQGQIASLWISLFGAILAIGKLLFDLVGNRGSFFVTKNRSGPNRPKVLDQYGEHRFVRLAKQNVRLHYVESGSADKQLMVMVHGFPECWFSWRHQIRAFSKDYHVVAVNMRGYGESDKPDGVANYAFEILVSDIVELIESLSPKRSPQKCILLGHDWGGLISWAVAQTRPDLVERLVVFNAPHIDPWIYRLATSWRQFVSSWYIYLFNIPLLPELLLGNSDLAAFSAIFRPLVQNEEEISAYKHYFSHGPNALTGPLNYYRAILRGFGSGERYPLAKFEPKTLIVWGKGDVALISELAQDSAALCLDGSVVYSDTGTHWVHQEQAPLVNQILEKFFESNICQKRRQQVQK